MQKFVFNVENYLSLFLEEDIIVEYVGKYSVLNVEIIIFLHLLKKTIKSQKIQDYVNNVLINVRIIQNRKIFTRNQTKNSMKTPKTKQKKKKLTSYYSQIQIIKICLIKIQGNQQILYFRMINIFLIIEIPFSQLLINV
ncbi:hypothetical protein IMG5_121430 [Ichthyophthirius multifiliis]|uniref:Transmembrane protein n=1 Tax=Ichthyophthirius multifiliis TaxID=5932 RepID=G0QV56_ICHMU|nr:hypothetical protein IMG5_121430 [Ichthyophthirius multifiliis]EGR30897.1 hypothetical protein IMG5_121430 [Ichthyophthirius multifiliis]|eukprot:XP_004032484.1 hypothetical protein IMG5_121430 [Ichthyophthirius multifiliis]